VKKLSISLVAFVSLVSPLTGSFAKSHDPRLPEASLEVGLTDFSGQQDDLWTGTEIRRTEPFIRLESRFLGRLYLVFQLKTSVTEDLWVRQTYGEIESLVEGQEPLRIDVKSHLRSRFTQTYGFGLRGIIWKNPKWMLQSDVLFENTPRVDIDIKGAELVSDFQTIDLTKLVVDPEAIRAEYEWKKFDTGVKMEAAPNDRLAIYGRIGFTALFGSIRLNYSDSFAGEVDFWAEKLTETFGWAPIVLKHRFNINYYAPTFTLGAELRLWDSISLNTSGSYTYADEGTLWIGQVGFIFRGDK